MKTSKLILAFACCISISGCDSEQERQTKAWEQEINSTIHIDWRDGIPLDELVDADKICQQRPSLKGCGVLQGQVMDIAISVASCRANPQSTLCRAAIRALDIPPISALLSKTAPLPLPDNPFYWKMPTATLEALAPHFGYRREALGWWWQRWNVPAFVTTMLLTTLYFTWFWWSERRIKQREMAEKIARLKAAKEEEERVRRIREEQARVEAERQATLDREAAAEEQQRQLIVKQRQDAEQLAQKQAAERAAQLAREQDEAAKLLEAAFQTPKNTKRSRNDNPSA